jgi:hypothetical protein
MTNLGGKTSFRPHIECGTQRHDADPAAVLVQILCHSQRAFDPIFDDTGLGIDAFALSREAPVGEPSDGR